MFNAASCGYSLRMLRYATQVWNMVSPFIAAVMHPLVVSVVESNDVMGEFGGLPGMWAVPQKKLLSLSRMRRVIF